MVQASEIRDKETLQAWLEARPEATRQRDAVIIAHRAAMRVLPYFVQDLNEGRAQKSDLTALAILRANLTSGASAGDLVPNLKSPANRAAAGAHRAVDSLPENTRVSFFAAFAAARAAETSTRPTDTAASAAASVVDTALRSAALYSWEEESASKFWEVTRQDARQIEQGTAPSHEPLWTHLITSDDPILRRSSDEINPIIYNVRRLWKLARAWLSAHPGHDFWIRWYEAALEGRPLTGDWESHDRLFIDIALIPEEDWQQGAEHVAGLIAEIEKSYWISATPNAEKIALDEDSRFYSLPVTTIRQQSFHDACDRVTDAMQEVRATLTQGNALYACIEPELDRVEEQMTKYSARPQMVHDAFERAQRMIEWHITEYDLAADPHVGELLIALDEGCIDIRRADTEVAKKSKSRASVKFRRLSAAKREAFLQSMKQAAAESQPELAEMIEQNIAQSSSEDVPDAVREASDYDLVSRGSRMAKLRETAVKAADDGVKIGRAVEMAGSVSDAASPWFHVVWETLKSAFS